METKDSGRILLYKWMLNKGDKTMSKKTYRVTYYYLATGMEGVADTRDFGLIEADSEEEAFEYVVSHLDTGRQGHSLETNKCHRYWGLSAKKVNS